MTGADLARLDARLGRIEAALAVLADREPAVLWRPTAWITETYGIGRSQLYALERRGVIDGSQGGRIKLWYVPDVHAYVTGEVLPVGRPS